MSEFALMRTQRQFLKTIKRLKTLKDKVCFLKAINASLDAGFQRIQINPPYSESIKDGVHSQKMNKTFLSLVS